MIRLRSETNLEQNDLSSTPVELATELTIAWLSNPNTRAQAEDIPAFLRSMHEAVVSLGEAPVEQPEAGRRERRRRRPYLRAGHNRHRVPTRVPRIVNGRRERTLHPVR